MGARQAQLRGFGVHQLHKRLHAAGGVLCQHIGRVVGTGQDRGMEQIVERHDLSRLQRDMGRARLQRIDRVRADRDLLRHVAAACFHSQRQRHNLRDTGWIIPLGAALLYEHLPLLCIHDKVCVRRHLRRHGAAFGVHRPSQTRRQRQRQDHPQQFLHLPHSSPLLSALPPKTSYSYQWYYTICISQVQAFRRLFPVFSHFRRLMPARLAFSPAPAALPGS